MKHPRLDERSIASIVGYGDARPMRRMLAVVICCCAASAASASDRDIWGLPKLLKPQQMAGAQAYLEGVNVLRLVDLYGPPVADQTVAGEHVMGFRLVDQAMMISCGLTVRVDANNAVTHAVFAGAQGACSEMARPWWKAASGAK